MAVRMSRKIWIIVAIAVVAVGATVGITLSHSPASPTDLTLPITTWNETSLSVLEGTPVVLNFWSITCPWCVYQLPFLEAVAQQSAGGLEVIAINTANSAGAIRDFFVDYEPAMTIAVDQNRRAFLDYCLGLGLPFIAVSLALGAASRFIRWLSRHAFVTSIVAAVLLISVGILMLTGYLEYLSALLPGGYQYGS